MSIIPHDTPTPIPIKPLSFQDEIGSFISQNWVLILTLIISAIIFISIYLLVKRILNKKSKKSMLFTDFNVGKFKIVLYRKIGNKYHEIDRRKMIVEQNKFTYNGKDFTTFDIQKIGFSDKKNNYYCFDYDSGAILTFSKTDMPNNLKIEDVDTYVNRGIIEQLVKGLEELKPKGQWILLIVGIIMGVAIGIIIGMYVAPSFSHTTTTPTNTPIPTPLADILLKLGVG